MHYRDAAGRYLGAWDGATPPEGAIAVTTPPPHRDAVWTGSAWAYDATPALTERRAAAVLPRETFAENAAMAGIITWEEAANWTAGNALPAVVQPLMAATPATERGKLTFTLLARRNVRRMAPEIVALGTLMGMTDAQVDALFGL